jgi:hypothetical protein
MWRCGVGAAYLLPALSLAGASLAAPCFRFHIPLIDPDGPISGIRLSEKVRKFHDVAHGKLRVRLVRQTRLSTSCSEAFGNLLVPGHTSLCLAHNH